MDYKTDSPLAAVLIGACSFAASSLQLMGRHTNKYSVEDFCNRWAYILQCPSFHVSLRRASQQTTWNPLRMWWVFNNYILPEMKAINQSIVGREV